MALDIKEIQEYLKERKLDGWLLADFHGRNNIAVEFLQLTGLVTRRSFYLIPAQGEPVALVNPIEKDRFVHLPGQIKPCFGYKELERQLATALKNVRRVAMEFSPAGRLPYIGLVDAGTIELVSNHVNEIVSSADLVANFQARLTDEQIETHTEAAGHVLRIKDETFQFVAECLIGNKPLTEYDCVQFILDQFDKSGMETSGAPICGVNGNAGNPHYEPSRENSAGIAKGQLLLLDLWGKLKLPAAVFADITWMAFAGEKGDIPQKYHDVFSVVCKARDAAIDYLQNNWGEQPLFGADVDDAVRNVINEAGYGRFFTHRTGHSITTQEHGVGPNIDNLETEDRRMLQPGHLFSIEPGIYMDDCGFRSEINILITANGPKVTTLPLQNEITPLF